MAHLHQLEPPLVHNDLKPSNCIVKSNERCALIDFGISGNAGETRVCRGTMGFVTPRPVDPTGEPLLPHNDLYGLGRTLELTLAHPALAAYHQALVAQCKHDEPRERPTAVELLVELQSVWQATPLSRALAGGLPATRSPERGTLDPVSHWGTILKAVPLWAW